MLYPLSYEGGPRNTIGTSSTPTAPWSPDRGDWRVGTSRWRRWPTRQNGRTMADPLALVAARLAPAFEALAGEPVDPVVRASDHADAQVNGALSLAKRIGRNPREVAQEIVDRAGLDGVVEAFEIAGPGFINVTFADSFVAEQLAAVGEDERLGVRSTPTAETVIVDYSAPNVAKEMHVGHLRTTIIGDSLVRLLEFVGDKVVRENHIGDWGTPFGMLIEHLLDEGEGEAANELAVGELDTFYRAARAKFDSDDDFKERAQLRVVALQAFDPETMRLWQRLVDESTRYFNVVYDKLGVLLTDDDLAGESRYHLLLPEVISRLDEQGLLQESDGAKVVFPDGFTNREGDPLPLIVQKRDGGFNYATSDLACVIDRVERVGATLLVYVVGAPQAQHFQMVFAVSQQAGWLRPPARAVHVGFGNVLGSDRKMFKTRSGDTVRLEDLLDEAIERASAQVEDKSPDLPAATKAAVGQGRRHRRAEVRRPLQRPRQGLRVRLGPDAVVRRQHRAVPAVRPRQDPLDPAPGRGRPGDAGRRTSPSRRTAGAGAGARRARLRRRRAGDGRDLQPPPAVHVPLRPGEHVHRVLRGVPRAAGARRGHPHQPPGAVPAHRAGARVWPRPARHRRPGAHVTDAVAADAFTDASPRRMGERVRGAVVRWGRRG